MLPYAATPNRASVKRSFGERSKKRRSRNPVRAEKKAARRAGRLMIEREIVEAKAAEAALAAEERLWQEEMRFDELMQDLDREEEQQYWDDWVEEPEPYVLRDPYDDDFYYQFLRDEEL